MIIAVDFDGTLKIGNDPNLNLISKLRSEQSKGNIVILWTCREGKSLHEAINYLDAYGFRPNYVNMNCPQALNVLKHDSRKIYADIYIDDKAVR